MHVQLMEYKVKWTESQTELQQQLKSAKKVMRYFIYMYKQKNLYGPLCDEFPALQEVREAFLAKEKAEEEFRELADAVEMATLDKEMAEERVSPNPSPSPLPKLTNLYPPYFFSTSAHIPL